MANTLLTPDMITKEALRILHEKLAFVGTINREYDASFAVDGAKIGDSLRIRKPAQYTVRTGKTLSTQDHTEQNTTLTVSTQKGVDVKFSSVERTMDLDDFSKRVLEPQMAVLASNIEADVLQGATQAVYNLVGTPGTTPNSMLTFGQARAKLNQYLAPKDNQRCIQIDSLAVAEMVNTLKGLFHDDAAVSKQYREGMMGRTSGFDWYEQEKVLVHTNGSDVTGVTLNTYTITDGDSDINITGASAAPAVGSVFTIAGAFAVHPETKDAYSHLQQFVVESATTSAITFSPTIYTTGARQNISAVPGTTAALTFVGAASTDYPQHLAYHKDFCTFATADLVKPEGVDFCSRQVFDGISLRIVRAYDINNDEFPCRIDVLYGYKAIRPELACRITG